MLLRMKGVLAHDFLPPFITGLIVAAILVLVSVGTSATPRWWIVPSVGAIVGVFSVLVATLQRRDGGSIKPAWNILGAGFLSPILVMVLLATGR